MSRASDIARISAKGSFHFFWGLVVSTLILAIGTIFIARLLGSNLYGLYGVIFTAPTLISLFRDWGVNSAVTQFTAQYKSEGRVDEIRSVLASGLIFEIMVGFALSIVSFGLSGFIASSIFHRPGIVSLVRIASFSILGGGIANAATGTFTGIEKMEPNSVMLILQSIVKTVAVVVLVILGLSVSGATIGYTVSFIAGAIVGSIFVWNIYRKLPETPNGKLQIRAYMTAMFSYGMPLSLAGNLSGLLSQFYVVLLPIYYVTNNSPIGNYSIAQTFAVLITFVATPINTMLFPAFSKINPQKEGELLQNVFQYSVKYSSLLVVPTAALVMCLSQPGVSLLFGSTYSSAPLFLALLSINYLFTAFGNLSIGAFLSGQGKNTYKLKLAALTGALGFPLGYVMIMHFGVLGLIVAGLISGVPSLVLSLRWIKKHYDLSVDWFSSARILLCAGVAGVPAYFLVSSLPIEKLADLVIGLVFFLGVFVTAAVVTRAINRPDIAYLRSMSSGLGIISVISAFFLGLVERVDSHLTNSDSVSN